MHELSPMVPTVLGLIENHPAMPSTRTSAIRVKDARQRSWHG